MRRADCGTSKGDRRGRRTLRVFCARAGWGVDPRVGKRSTAVSLCTWEAACRARIRVSPDDLHARAGLARCLLMQALRHVGRACLRPASLVGVAAGRTRRPWDSPRPAGLLRECLTQARIAQRLTADPSLSESMGRLTLLTGVWGDDALNQAQASADRRLAALLRDVAPFPARSRRAVSARSRHAFVPPDQRSAGLGRVLRRRPPALRRSGIGSRTRRPQ